MSKVGSAQRPSRPDYVVACVSRFAQPNEVDAAREVLATGHSPEEYDNIVRAGESVKDRYYERVAMAFFVELLVVGVGILVYIAATVLTGLRLGFATTATLLAITCGLVLTYVVGVFRGHDFEVWRSKRQHRRTLHWD